ncbi:MAG: 30S ribosome-binding factor RbfA [Planctomycetota bacterium]
MSSRRVLKAAQAIREVVSMAIITDLKDPRISDVTVTMVEVSADLRQAKVNVSVMGDEKKQSLCLHGLQSAAGYLQKKVGTRIDTKYTPRIEFVIDKGMQNAMTVTRILEEVLPRERAAAENADSVSTDDHEPPIPGPGTDTGVDAEETEETQS